MVHAFVLVAQSKLPNGSHLKDQKPRPDVAGAATYGPRSGYLSRKGVSELTGVTDCEWYGMRYPDPGLC